MSRNKRIAIIGPYPPPYGGISVHIERMLSRLPKENIHFFNTNKTASKGIPFYSIWIYIYVVYFLVARYKVIHYHSTSKKIRFLLSLVSFFKRNVFFHLHGASFLDTINEATFMAKKIKSLIPCTNFIASNENIFHSLSELNPRSIYLYDAFIPPTFNQNDLDLFTEAFELPSSQYIVCMVGWFSKYKQEDLYGFDITLDVLYSLINKYDLDISLIASVNGVNDKALYDSFLHKRAALNLTNRFILIESKPKEIYPLFLYSHLFIRPTNTDGNSVSVKEALWFETPIIASDAVPRPKEAYLFKNRDADDLAEKIMYVIKNQQFLSLQKKIDVCKSKTYRHPIIKDIYELE
ncbi:MAG: glycosyltransferase [Salinivirgaceae bacterium]|jgi:glycosyltransferase involved in cell wall biosynthesis